MIFKSSPYNINKASSYMKEKMIIYMTGHTKNLKEEGKMSCCDIYSEEII